MKAIPGRPALPGHGRPRGPAPGKALSFLLAAEDGRSRAPGFGHQDLRVRAESQWAGRPSPQRIPWKSVLKNETQGIPGLCGLAAFWEKQSPGLSGWAQEPVLRRSRMERSRSGSIGNFHSSRSRAATTRSSSPPCEAAAWGPEPQPSATPALTAGTGWRRLPRAGLQTRAPSGHCRGLSQCPGATAGRGAGRTGACKLNTFTN